MGSPIRQLTPAGLDSAIAVEPTASFSTRSSSALIAEVRRVGALMSKDAVLFKAKGISDDFLDTSEPLAQKLEHVETEWMSAIFMSSNLSREWLDLRTQGVELVQNTLSHYRVAFIEPPAQQKELATLGKVKNNGNLVLLLKKLSKLGRLNLALVGAVGVTEEMLSNMTALSNQLAVRLAKNRRSASKEVKTKREQTKSFAERWLQTVRKFGKLACKENPERASLYSDTRVRLVGKKANSSPATSAVEPKQAA